MKIKLKSFRKSTMKSLVMLNPSGGSVAWKNIGDIVEVSDDFGHSLLSSCHDMLEICTEEKVFENKVIDEVPENKMIETKSKSKKG